MIEPKLVPLFQKGFAKTSRVLLERLFSEVWIDKSGAFSQEKGWPQGGPLFLYSTHSSWWDPIAAAYLSVEFMKRRTIAPMDESEFKRYRSLRFVGLFGVSQGDGEKVHSLIEEQLQQHPKSCVWVTPQGKFSPNELDQPKFKNGLARWAQIPGSVCVPVAIHYWFGHLPRPFIFYRLGEAIESIGRSAQPEKYSEQLRKALSKETKLLLENIWQAQQQMSFKPMFEKAG